MRDQESASGAGVRLPHGWPPSFLWGAATSSFQIEGDVAGRGSSIWDALCEQPDSIIDGSDGSVACDHVNRYAEDVALLAALDVDAYRFSISWPRVQPGGRGKLARGGLDFYDRLIDELLGNGVQPWVTLYHWDLPLELEQAGGWPQRDIVDRFTDYAVAVHSALGDRVRHWLTLNEPWCSAWLGYGAGLHAPGVQDHRQATRAAHHLLLAHGRATRALREQAPFDHQIGIVLNLMPVRPARGRWGDVSVKNAVRLIDGVQNRWFLDALFRGSYPDDVLKRFGPWLDGLVRQGDNDEIAAPLDLLGVNYYFDQLVDVYGPAERTLSAAYPVPARITTGDPGDDATSMGWPVTPQGFRDILVRIGAEYPAAPPLVVTENGSAHVDPPLPGNGAVIEDPARVSYLRRHLSALSEAVGLGADVRGYFAWSLLDNFEWAYGYSQRFGIVHVDFDTQQRRRKRSFEVYRQAIAAARGSARQVV